MKTLILSVVVLLLVGCGVEVKEPLCSEIPGRLDCSNFPKGDGCKDTLLDIECAPWGRGTCSSCLPPIYFHESYTKFYNDKFCTIAAPLVIQVNGQPQKIFGMVSGSGSITDAVYYRASWALAYEVLDGICVQKRSYYWAFNLVAFEKVPFAPMGRNAEHPNSP